MIHNPSPFTATMKLEFTCPSGFSSVKLPALASGSASLKLPALPRSSRFVEENSESPLSKRRKRCVRAARRARQFEFAGNRAAGALAGISAPPVLLIAPRNGGMKARGNPVPD